MPERTDDVHPGLPFDRKNSYFIRLKGDKIEGRGSVMMDRDLR